MKYTDMSFGSKQSRIVRKMKIVCAMIVATCVFLLCSCAVATTNADSKGNILVYTTDNLPDGVFVLRNEKFYPLMPSGTNFHQNAEKSDGNFHPERFIWFVGKEYLIPELDIEADDQLVIKSSEFEAFREVEFEEMADIGYTIGMTMTNVDGSAFWAPTGDFCAESDVSKSVGSSKNSEGVAISGINDQKIIGSMISPIGTIANLQQHGIYNLGVYIGTSYVETAVVADTRAFVSKGFIKSVDISLTRSGYAIINIPSEIQKGYYNVANSGLVRILKKEPQVEQASASPTVQTEETKANNANKAGNAENEDESFTQAQTESVVADA